MSAWETLALAMTIAMAVPVVAIVWFFAGVLVVEAYEEALIAWRRAHPTGETE